MKTKGSVVDEVMRKVAQHRSSLSFAAAMEDEQRRHGRLATWNRITDVRAARRDIPLLARMPVEDFNQTKEDILLHECPEALRLAVTNEWVARARRAPQTGTGDEVENRAVQ